ncbi:MAG: MBL fold metallo-hydrolase [Candidatus Methanoplasma sp.]|jgi:7,8-dihydropterin-6-yl-methyl-4-(beta-D-ribofuranosyl)aminobenzene 5'-phosphate synthase|nr:MBL fold metallo-hydrolase [Candidatus Methanoplasma sp.]
MSFTVRCVYDEGAAIGTSFIGAKGFSLLIEADGKRVLFDAGKRGRYLLHNLGLMGVDADSIDAVVISCGHADHTGGLRALLKERTVPLNIYAPASAAGVKTIFGSKGLYIPEEYSEKAIVSPTGDWTEISDRMHMSPPFGKEGESFLVIDASGGPAVLSARSGFGVGKAVSATEEKFGRAPAAYVGGVLMRRNDDSGADAAAAVFSASGCRDLHLNHCTGQFGITRLRVNLGLAGVKDFYVGESIEL